MTWRRDVLYQRKSSQDPKVFPVSQPSLITHNAVTLVFKGHEKQDSFHMSINIVEDFYVAQMIYEKLTTSRPRKSAPSNRWQWRMTYNALWAD